MQDKIVVIEVEVWERFIALKKIKFKHKLEMISNRYWVEHQFQELKENKRRKTWQKILVKIQDLFCKPKDPFISLASYDKNKRETSTTNWV